MNEWSGKGWTITVTDTQLVLIRPSDKVIVPSSKAHRLRVQRRWLRWSLRSKDEELTRLRGISGHEARELGLAVNRLSVAPAVADAVAWHRRATRLVDGGLAEQRWIPTEDIDELLANRPAQGLIDRVCAAKAKSLLTDRQLDAVNFLDVDFEALVSRTNEQIMAAELISQRLFFDSIEQSPLTDEQARAVVCFDNRVQVLAAAGSGKTSVMVARAAYAVSRGFVPPKRILLLAFNKSAAKELEERITARFKGARIDSTGVRASTFHSFGLDVIGKATGEKPRLASWLDQGNGAGMVMRLVDELRDSSETFRYRWDLYRMLFANAPIDLKVNEPDGYDRASAQTGYQTFAGEIVKSHGERLVANFLYLNGINYEYERPYDADVADATHSQYRPDFYYPDIDVWHEHWALGRDGEPPEEFTGYAESMAWKRQVHARHGSKLVESTWANVVFGSGLEVLQAELEDLGLTFDWNPDRSIAADGTKPVKHEDLAKLVRTFMAHVKSNSWEPDDLDERLESDLPQLKGLRTSLFLGVYWQVHAAWERRLAADRSVDFEDMLVLAANHLNNGDVDFPYDLIMVDEFQDASQARARLVRGLVNTPGRFLLAVGDDWQAINRFAGADVSVMTEFEAWFGCGPQLALTTTFRCPQTICDVASTFVSKNPSQFNKPMRSSRTDPGPPVTVIRAHEPADAVADYLDRLSEDVAGGTVAPASDGKVSVYILGRYRFEQDCVPTPPPDNLRVTSRTIHGAKGLEADYILIPGMSTGTYGFPSTIIDDPVLGLAMPAPENYSHAEERRLFYVALTRARRAVTLIAPTHRMSPFVVELVDDSKRDVRRRERQRRRVCRTHRSLLSLSDGNDGAADRQVRNVSCVL